MVGNKFFALSTFFLTWTIGKVYSEIYAPKQMFNICCISDIQMFNCYSWKMELDNTAGVFTWVQFIFERSVTDMKTAALLVFCIPRKVDTLTGNILVSD